MSLIGPIKSADMGTAHTSERSDVWSDVTGGHGPMDRQCTAHPHLAARRNGGKEKIRKEGRKEGRKISVQG